MMSLRKQITIATLISLIVHLFALLTIIWLSGFETERSFGEKYAVISVDVIIEADEEEVARDRKEEVEKLEDKMKIREKEPPKTARPKELRPAKEREGTGSIGIPGIPGDKGRDQILAQIRAKIESAKRYPRPARRMKIEGRPTVLFQINSDGSLKFVNIAKSCGKTILDNAAIETVKKAAPLPYYEKPIRLKIKYEMKE